MDLVLWIFFYGFPSMVLLEIHWILPPDSTESDSKSLIDHFTVSHRMQSSLLFLHVASVPIVFLARNLKKRLTYTENKPFLIN